MLISVRSLVDRLRHPVSRVHELESLRARFAGQPSTREAGAEATALAQDIRRHKRELAEALVGARACSGCAVRRPLPEGRWSGGYCCGTKTLNVFSPAEVAALKLAGTRANDLVPPRSDHAGCSFRGPTGCSLEAENRPSICVRYICFELRAELRPEPRWARIAAASRALTAAFTRFEAELDKQG